MQILAQFLLRLAFGLAVGMAITSPRQVSSGFFRNHLYVTLGLSTLAALVATGMSWVVVTLAALTAVSSYVGSVCWLYEKKQAGRIAILIVVLTSLYASMELTEAIDALQGQAVFDRYFPEIHGEISVEEANRLAAEAQWSGHLSGALTVISPVSSGLLLGITLAAMLLGHWYLNSPTMELAPLRRLLRAMGAALALQTVVSAVGLACELIFATELPSQWVLFIVLRWSFGLVGVGVLAWMAWQTLKVPNTQSATGILYVAVIGVFVGELAAELLSAQSAYPL